METAVIIAIIGVISTIVSGVTSWLVGRKRTKAEVSLLQANNLEAIRSFYEKVQEDNTKKLDYYISLSEENCKDIRRLKAIVNKLLDDACLKRGCELRQHYSYEEIEDMVGSKKSKEVEE